MEDKGGRPRFFQEIFLVADTKFEVILEIFFLKINNADVTFDERTLMYKFYTTSKALSTTERVQLFNLKKFVIAALDVDSKPFVVYVAIQGQKKLVIDFDKKAQMKTHSKAQIRALLFNKAPT